MEKRRRSAIFSFSNFLDFLFLLTEKYDSSIRRLPRDYAKQALECTNGLPDQADQSFFRKSEIAALKISIYYSLGSQKNKPIYDKDFSGFGEKDYLNMLKEMCKKREGIRVFNEKSLSFLFRQSNIYNFLVKLENF